MIYISRLLTILLCLSFVLGGCSSRPAAETKLSKPMVAVSIVPQASWIQAIAGDLVDVVIMIPPGKSAETYTPTPQQMTQLSKASLYFAMQVPAETASILPKLPDLNPKARIVDLAAATRSVYPERELADHGHGHSHGPAHDGRDPHIWLSPKRAMVMVQTTAAELAAFDPQNKTVYDKNAQAYLAKLRELDQKIQNLLKDSQKKTFLIYHPALGYFADDYGLHMLALEAGGKDATPQALQKTIAFAKQANFKAILYEAEMDSRQAKTFAAEIGGVAQMISPFAADYIGGLEHIAQTIAEGAR